MQIRIPSVGRRIYLLSFLALQRVMSTGEVEVFPAHRWDDWDARAFFRRHFHDPYEIGVLRSTLARDHHNATELSDDEIVAVAAQRVCSGVWCIGYEQIPPTPAPERPAALQARAEAAGLGATVVLDSLTGPNGRPGDLFDSADSAAIAVLKYINQKSVCRDLEHGGWIYKENGNTGNEKFFFTEPQPGEQHGFPIPSSRHPRGNAVAIYHTHGAASKMDPVTGNFYDDENFSRYVVHPDGQLTGDTRTADRFGVPIYLGTPNGKIKKYTPKPGKPDRGKVEKIGTMPRIRERRDCPD